jgi:hypothetical protein
VLSDGSPAPTSHNRSTVPFAGSEGATTFVSYLNSDPSALIAAKPVRSFSVDAGARARFGVCDATSPEPACTTAQL